MNKFLHLLPFIFATVTYGQTLADWNFSWLDTAQSSTNLINATSYSSTYLDSLPIVQRMAGGYNQSGTWNLYTYTRTLDAAIANNSYFEFTLSPSTAIRVTSISYAASKGGSTPPYFVYFSLFAALNGSASYQQIGTSIELTATNRAAPQTITFATSQYADIYSSSTFRTYFYGAGTNAISLGSSTNNLITGIQVQGLAIPEAGAALLFTLGFICIALFKAIQHSVQHKC